MARARQIKYSFFENEVLGVDDADPLCSLMFIGLWCLADREGRLVDRPLKIWGKLFPLRKLADPNAMLDWLMDKGFIDRYEVDGQRYIQILNFKLHQNPHPNEKLSEIPQNLSKNANSRENHDKQPSTRALTSYSSLPSLSSFPSLEDGETPVAAAAADDQETDLWTAGIELLKTAKMTEAQARPFLGRLAQQYTAAELHTAIAVTSEQKPADAKAFLIGVLKKRAKDKAKTQVGKYVPDAKPPKCGKCDDHGTILVEKPPDQRQYDFERDELPCPACSPMTEAAAV